MIAYFDCFSGISGDMIVGALIDAGVPFDWLDTELRKLPLEGYDLAAEDVTRGGIGGKRFIVSVKGGQPERRLSDITSLIGRAPIDDGAKALSIEAFERLAAAEGRIHRIGPGDVHFHEVGAVDSIIDIVGAALSLSRLGVKKVYSSPLPLSTGTVKCSHGELPIPAPATAELLKGVPVRAWNGSGEMVTPTGAAFLAAVGACFGPLPEMTVRSIGYGAGARENEGLPNLLRVITGHDGAAGDDEAGLSADTVTVVEANIDDMNPEFYGFVTERLFREGALDVSLIPAYMKKGRPGTILQVLCGAGQEEKITAVILRETSTIGVRYYAAGRVKLSRKSVYVETRFGRIAVKSATAPWGERGRPEYDDCVKAAREHKVPVQEVWLEALKSFDGRDHEG